jgi:hypothetical protein
MGTARYRRSWVSAALVSLSLLLVSVLTGCGAANIERGYSLDGRKGTGVAVVSLAQSGIAGNYATSVSLRGVENSYDDSVPMSNRIVSMDWSCPLFAAASEDAPCGRLAIIELPQGEYEFYSWIARGNLGPGVSTEFRPTKLFSKRFKVFAGKAVYLGNFHIMVPTGLFRGAYRIKTTDMQQRDLPLFYQKHPNITSESVFVSILPD